MQEKNIIFRKSLVIGIILLFIGAGVIPVISGNFEKLINVSDLFVSKNTFDLDFYRSDSDPIDIWHKTFNNSIWDRGNCVQQTDDGGYIVVGGSEDIPGISYVWLIKTDSSGNIVWNRIFGGGGGNDCGHSVRQTDDGGYIIAGETATIGAGDFDFWLLKTGIDGHIVWSKTFGGEDRDIALWVEQSNDGGYILVGETKSFGAGDRDIWLIKTDSSGNMIWNKTYGGFASDEGYEVHQTTDGGYIITGGTYSYGAGYCDVWLIKTDTSGNIVWNKTYGGGGQDIGFSAQQTLDSGYIITGPYSTAGSGSDVWLIKTDPNGNIIWDKTYGDFQDDVGFNVRQTSDGGYVVAGTTRLSAAGDSDGWLIKTDVFGNIIWDKTFGEVNTDDIIFSAEQTIDGGYIMTGYTSSYGSYGNDLWLIKNGVNPVEFDLLILTDEAFVDVLGPLSDHKNSTGIKTHICTWQQFDDHFDGRDEAERVKRGLAMFHEMFKISSVLIVGDCDCFPVRYTMTDRAEPAAFDRAFYSADLYYADLYKPDGSFDTWDINEDGYYGELHGETLSDVVNVDDVDLHLDLMVGRIPVSNAVEVTNYVNKVISYEFAAYSAPWFKRAVLIATIDWVLDICDTKDDISDSFPPGFTSVKLYQLNNPCVATPEPTSININNELNQNGAGFINYLGHGTVLAWQIPGDWYEKIDIQGLFNQNMLPIAFAGTCSTSQYTTQPPYHPYLDIYGVHHIGTDNGEVFTSIPPQPSTLQAADNPVCFAEQFLVERDTGVIAYIGCVTGSQDWCRYLDYFFYEMYYDGCKLGEMYNYMIERYYLEYPIPERINPPDWYEFSKYHQPWKYPLFGDPTLRVGGTEFIDNSEPDPPDILGPTSGVVGEAYEFEFSTIDPDGHDIYYYIDWGDDTGVICTGTFPSGDVIKLGHIWSDKGIYLIRVKAKDVYDAESDWTTLEVNIPRNRSFTTPLFNRFTNLFPILRILLQRLG